MKEQLNSGSRRYDKPIPKPPDEVLERFIRSTEARFVTKRFKNDRPPDRKIDRLDAR